MTAKKKPPSRPKAKPFYPPMGKGEYGKALDFYGMHNTQFSALIGVGWRQGQRYLDGVSTIPDTTAKLIRTAIRHRLAPHEIG